MVHHIDCLTCGKETTWFRCPDCDEDLWLHCTDCEEDKSSRELHQRAKHTIFLDGSATWLARMHNHGSA